LICVRKNGPLLLLVTFRMKGGFESKTCVIIEHQKMSLG